MCSQVGLIAQTMSKHAYSQASYVFCIIISSNLSSTWHIAPMLDCCFTNKFKKAVLRSCPCVQKHIQFGSVLMLHRVLVHRAYIHCVFSSPCLCSTHTPSITFRHLPPNSAGIGYATEGAPFISGQLSTNVVSALWKIWVLIRQTSSTGLRYLSNHCHSWLRHRSRKTVS